MSGEGLRYPGAPLRFLGCALSRQKVPSTNQQKAADRLKARPFVQAMALPSKCGFTVTMTVDTLEREDAGFQAAHDFSQALLAAIESVEFDDANTPARVQLHDPAWAKLWSEVKGMGLLVTESYTSVFGGVAADELGPAMKPIANCLSALAREFIDAQISALPWVKKFFEDPSTVKGNPKIPAQQIELSASPHLPYYCEVAIECVAGEGCVVDVAKYAEMANLGKFYKYCTAYWSLSCATATKKSLVCDSPHRMSKWTGLLEDYLELLEDAVRSADVVPSKRLHAYLMLERNVAKQTFSLIYTADATYLGKLLREALRHADADSLQLEALWADGKPPSEEILTRVNSDTAKALRQAWTPLSTAFLTFNNFRARLNCEVYGFLAFSETEAVAGWEELENGYKKVVDKISEITAARSLVRPVPKDTSREGLVDQALATIAELGGELGASLDLLMKQLSGSSLINSLMRVSLRSSPGAAQQGVER